MGGGGLRWGAKPLPAEDSRSAPTTRGVWGSGPRRNDEAARFALLSEHMAAPDSWPRQDPNLRFRLRRATFHLLGYGDRRPGSRTAVDDLHPAAITRTGQGGSGRWLRFVRSRWPDRILG